MLNFDLIYKLYAGYIRYNELRVCRYIMQQPKDLCNWLLNLLYLPKLIATKSNKRGLIILYIYNYNLLYN